MFLTLWHVEAPQKTEYVVLKSNGSSLNLQEAVQAKGQDQKTQDAPQASSIYK